MALILIVTAFLSKLAFAETAIPSPRELTIVCSEGSYAATDTAESCTLCPVGTYNPSVGAKQACTPCAKGTSQSMEGASVCVPCADSSYTWVTGATVCVPVASHEWEFRGCTTGAAVQDTRSTMLATPFNDPVCSSEGISFDGVNQYLTLQSWSWGGSTSFEAFVSYSALVQDARVFDFGNGQQSDDIFLATSSGGDAIFYGEILIMCAPA